MTCGNWGEWGGEGDEGGLDIRGGGPMSVKLCKDGEVGEVVEGGKGGRKIVPEPLRTTPRGDC